MSIFKTKKIAALSFLSLILISFLLPFSVQANLPMSLTVKNIKDTSVRVEFRISNPDNELKDFSAIRVRIYTKSPLDGSGVFNDQFNSNFITRNSTVDKTDLDLALASEQGTAFNYNNTNKGTGEKDLIKNTDYYALAVAIVGNKTYQSSVTHFKTANDDKSEGQVISTDTGNSVTGSLNQGGDTFQNNLGSNKTKPTETDYNLLAPIPGVGKDVCLPLLDKNGKQILDKDGNPMQNCTNTVDTKEGFANYLNVMIKVFIGICAVLAMVMIVVGGIQYMTSELTSEKADGKSKILNAVLGLILALGAYAILNTLNADLLNIGLGNLPKAKIKIDIGAEGTGNFQPINKTTLIDTGIQCNETGGKEQLINIAKSFKGHVIYSQTRPNTCDPVNKICKFDCSSFIAQVYKCAGLASPGNSSADMLPSENSTVNPDGSGLGNGDIIGWKMGESTKYKDGHVVMYIGGGKFIEVYGGGVRESSLQDYLQEFKHVKKTP